MDQGASLPSTFFQRHESVDARFDPLFEKVSDPYRPAARGVSGNSPREYALQQLDRQECR
jgi:hypothetical protein